MRFWIVTPSYNQLHFLKRCVASVRDQSGPAVVVHHHVQDGGSDDGTVEFFRDCENEAGQVGNYSFSFASAADEGMYEAINKGFALYGHKQAAGQRAGWAGASNGICRDDNGGRAAIFAYLNADEQYLECSLARVSSFYEANPDADILSGDSLLIDQDGCLLAFRKGYALRRAYIQASHMYNLTAAIFFRPQVWRELGFDQRLQTAADQDFIVRALSRGYRARHIRHYISVFTLMSTNQSLSSIAAEDYRQLRAEAPTIVRWCRPTINASRLLEKFMSGAYRQTFPLAYAIYAGDDLQERRLFQAESASFRWPKLSDGAGRL